MKPLTTFTLIGHSLRFRWRSHVGVLLGAAVGSAALIGALIVGDSVRESLRELALQRLGNIHFAMDTGDRFFRAKLGRDTTWMLADGPSGAAGRGSPALGPNATATLRFKASNRFASVPFSNTVAIPPVLRSTFPFGGTNIMVTVSPLLKLPATASSQRAEARANQVQLLGVDDSFAILAGASALSNLGPDEVVLNTSLAEQLQARPGDTVLLRTRKPAALATDSPVAPTENSSVVLRQRVAAILPPERLGNFSLSANQVPPFNAFVSLAALQEKAGAREQANLLLADLPVQVHWETPSFSWKQWFAHQLGRFHLRAISPWSPWRTNAVPSDLSQQNLTKALEARLEPIDLQLQLALSPTRPELELRSSRIFLDPPIVQAALEAMSPRAGGASPPPSTTPPAPGPAPYGVLTYLVNLLRHGDRATPYSMVTAAGTPLVPVDLRDHEMIISQWLADDLNAGPGSEIEMSYFLPDQASQLLERTNRFRVRSILPMSDPALDRTLMPNFPGIAEAEKAGDWQTGFPLQHKIREKDDVYWRTYRGTPKAFITLAAGQRLWDNRFGNLTAIRAPLPGKETPAALMEQTQIEHALREHLGPAARALGFRFEPVRERALAASAQAQDFGQLFLGFSFFLILAALILMALLFQFGLEQRASEVGLLLALGFLPARVRRLFLLEGTMIALAGGVVGVAGGIAYARAMIRGLTTLWRDAVGTSALQFHVTPLTLGIGLFASVVVCALTIWIVLRKQARQPARVLLAPGAEEIAAATPGTRQGARPKSMWVAAVAGALALALIGWALARQDAASAELFFGAGSLLLVSALAAVAGLLRTLERADWSRRLSVAAMGLRSCTRRRKRSLATVALLACGSFLVVAVGANRLDAGRDAAKRSSGTGGFALLGESTLPVVRDLNTRTGREFYGLDEAALRDVRFVPFRVRAGDDASCLNLNRAQNPRLLGVDPALLAERHAFTFARVLKGLDPAAGWALLQRPAPARAAEAKPGTEDVPEIPAIGDAASIEWALHLKLGDTLDYTDEQGRKFRVRLVGALANSLLQGNLIIDEAEFVKRFPSESGHRLFLIDVPAAPGATDKLSAILTRALQDAGLELTPCARRLAAFNAVQNTYLNTFQVLGGIGLLLGSAGLAVVVLRNVLERRGELALLRAVGFRRRSLHWLVLSEHSGLLWLGLGAGMIAALAAILPVLLAPGAEIHYRALLVTLLAVLASGMCWTWCATSLALRGDSLEALREE